MEFRGGFKTGPYVKKEAVAEVSPAGPVFDATIGAGSSLDKSKFQATPRNALPIPTVRFPTSRVNAYKKGPEVNNVGNKSKPTKGNSDSWTNESFPALKKQDGVPKSNQKNEKMQIQDAPKPKPTPRHIRQRSVIYLEESGIMRAMQKAVDKVCKDPDFPLKIAPSVAHAGFLEKLSYELPVKCENQTLVDNKAYLRTQMAQLHREDLKASENIREKQEKIVKMKHQKQAEANNRGDTVTQGLEAKPESVATDSTKKLMDGCDSNSNNLESKS